MNRRGRGLARVDQGGLPPTSFSVMGPASHVWRAAVAIHSGTTLTSMPNDNPTGPALSPNGAPIYNASSANFNNTPSISFGGTADFLLSASAVSLGSADQTTFGWAVLRTTDTTDIMAVLDYAAPANFEMQINTTGAGQPCQQGGTRTAASLATNIGSTSVLLWGIVEDANAGAGATNQISVNNGTPGTTTGTGPSNSSSGTVTVGRRGGASSFFYKGEIVEVGLCPFAAGSLPSAGLLAALHSVIRGNYLTP